MSKKKIIIGVLLTAVLSSFLTIAGLCFAFGIHSNEVADIVRFLGVKRFIEARYVSDVNETKLMDGAISGMVQSLGDPHSLYMNADRFEQLKEHTEGEFGGIGVTMGFKDSKVTIISVLDDTPGQHAGLEAGDEIMAVDGTPVSEMQPEEVAMHIRGEVGTDVILTIKRGDETKDYTIERATIKIDTAKGTMLEDGMGYIRIASFSENTGKEFKAAYDSLEEQGMKGLIIDLRENPGGLVTSCVEIANMVVPKGPIVSVVERDGSKEVHESKLEESKYPIVVLIDGVRLNSSRTDSRQLDAIDICIQAHVAITATQVEVRHKFDRHTDAIVVGVFAIPLRESSVTEGADRGARDLHIGLHITQRIDFVIAMAIQGTIPLAHDHTTADTEQIVIKQAIVERQIPGRQIIVQTET